MAESNWIVESLCEHGTTYGVGLQHRLEQIERTHDIVSIQRDSEKLFHFIVVAKKKADVG